MCRINTSTAMSISTEAPPMIGAKIFRVTAELLAGSARISPPRDTWSAPHLCAPP